MNGQHAPIIVTDREDTPVVDVTKIAAQARDEGIAWERERLHAVFRKLSEDLHNRIPDMRIEDERRVLAKVSDMFGRIVEHVFREE